MSIENMQEAVNRKIENTLNKTRAVQADSLKLQHTSIGKDFYFVF